MPRSRWLAVVATVTLFSACFADLGADVSGPTGSTGGTSTTTTTATTTTAATTTDGPRTTGPGTSLDPTGSGTCGDGILDPGEQCDPGGGNVGNGQCTPMCAANVCGDGHRAPNEGCDDGNSAAGDGCDAQCHSEACGNGLINAGEACDDGNDDDTDACTSLCQAPVCGDGLVHPTEACDDANLSDDDGCDATCQTVGCGNGVLQGSEQCDDGNAIDGDGCDACERKFFHVFVTSATYSGNLGGVAAADTRCNDLAIAAGLPGKYLAWLATSPDDEPADRFTPSLVPYVLSDGQTVVADSFEALLKGLLHPINQDEQGNSLAVDANACSASRTVWTGLLENGSAVGQNCAGWTNAGPELGNAGYLDDASQWSSACAATCDRALHLYCFEQ